MDALMVIHIGAGKHSRRQDNKYKKVIKKALLTHDNEGIKAIKLSSEVLDSVSLINSGYGAALNLEGNSDNDASFVQYGQQKVMKYFSCHNIKHNYPLQESFSLYDKIQRLYKEDLSKLGLISPNVVNYQCRDQVNKRLGIEEVELQTNIPDRQKKVYDLFKEGYLADSIDEQTEDEDCLGQAQAIQDTIGIIHRNNLDQINTLAASSGGNFLKLPGRIGCAGIVGAGLGYKFTNDEEINCMCSGTGEDITLISLANLVVNYASSNNLQVEHLHEIIKAEASKYDLKHVNNDSVYCGILLTIHDKHTHHTRLIYYHTTETFYFGYNNKGQIKIIQSRLNSVKQDYVVGEYMIK